MTLKDGSIVTFEMKKEFLALPESTIAPDAVIKGGSVIGRRSRIESLAQIDGSVIGDNAVVGSGASLTNCFVADGFEVPAQVIAVDNYFGF